MKKSILALLGLTILMSCATKQNESAGYIGPSDITITDGVMTPAVLLSLGRLSDPQLSPDGPRSSTASVTLPSRTTAVVGTSSSAIRMAAIKSS